MPMSSWWQPNREEGSRDRLLVDLRNGVLAAADDALAGEPAARVPLFELRLSATRVMNDRAPRHRQFVVVPEAIPSSERSRLDALDVTSSSTPASLLATQQRDPSLSHRTSGRCGTSIRSRKTP